MRLLNETFSAVLSAHFCLVAGFPTVRCGVIALGRGQIYWRLPETQAGPVRGPLWMVNWSLYELAAFVGRAVHSHLWRSLGADSWEIGFCFKEGKWERKSCFMHPIMTELFSIRFTVQKYVRIWIDGVRMCSGAAML